MKIILCTTQKYVPPFIGGVDVYTDRLGRALSRLGHEIGVIALDPSVETDENQITIRQDELHGTRVWRLQFSFAQRPKEAFDTVYDPEMGQAVATILREQQPDLFIILNFYMLTLAPVEVAKTLGIPIGYIATDFLPICRRATFIRWHNRSCQVGESIKSCAQCFVSHRLLGRLGSTILNQLPESTLLQLSSRQGYKLPHPLATLNPYWNQVAIMKKRLARVAPLRQMIDLVLVPTQFTQKMYLENGFRPDQVHHMPFGVDADDPLTRVKQVPADHIRFLFIGRFQPYKGAHLLIQAFNNLEFPKEATLTLYGAPDGHEVYFERLKKMMATNDRIRFPGRISPTELDKAFVEADYFVMPSTWHENSPLIVLDALQSRTPVISSDIGGITDIVHDGVNGLLFPMGDVKALQRVMQRAIDEPNLVQQLKAGVSLLSIDEYARRMLALCSHREDETVVHMSQQGS